MTMILSPLEFDHLVQVVHHPACGYRAECLCGWASRWTADAPTADAAARTHREQVEQATGTAATIVALLDLQDDLADAILWLAENWPADLPAVRARSCTDQVRDSNGRPGLALEAECDNPSDLADLASLLGGPRVADPEANVAGRRYERSVRRFGQVHITAVRVLDRS